MTTALEVVPTGSCVLALPVLLGHPWSLDLTCPVALPAKPLTGAPWPWPVAGPSVSLKSVDTFVRRRYLETLYLPDALAPLAALASDLVGLPAHLAPLLRPLPALLSKHRHIIQPVLKALVAATMTDTHGVVEGDVPDDEAAVLRIAVSLQVGCRAAEGRGVDVGKLGDELERRDVLIQLVLQLIITSSPPSTKPHRSAELAPAASEPAVPAEPFVEPVPSAPDASSKRKRKRDSFGGRKRLLRTAGSTADPPDPKAALEMLEDRVALWAAVADLGQGVGAASDSAHVGAGTGDAGSLSGVLHAFWADVLVPLFLSLAPAACASFHLKVFGRPMPSALLSTKKPRKPKLTHPLPARAPAAADDGRAIAKDERRGKPDERAALGLVRPPDVPRRSASVTSASGLRDAHAPRRLASREFADMAPTAGFARDRLGRSASASHDPGPRRSRSRSIEPRGERDLQLERELGRALSGDAGAGAAAGARAIERTVSVRKPARAPSGRDLFKHREVGIIKRTSSVVRRDRERDKESQAESVGLLGRRAAVHARRGSDELKLGSLGSLGTLVLATPSKPRHGHAHAHAQAFFAARLDAGALPTPIREEPGSASSAAASVGLGSGAAFVAETPVAPGRVRAFAGWAAGEHSGLADETPRAHWSVDGVMETPVAARMRIGGVPEWEQEDNEDDDDGLGHLMVMTDDEGDEDDGQRGPVVGRRRTSEGSAAGLNSAFVPETPRQGHF
ncbi:hypothetical protein Q5752_001950 [Cryptotrichosporon argae]